MFYKTRIRPKVSLDLEITVQRPRAPSSSSKGDYYLVINSQVGFKTNKQTKKRTGSIQEGQEGQDEWDTRLGILGNEFLSVQYLGRR